jgi:hypothetical protein
MAKLLIWMGFFLVLYFTGILKALLWILTGAFIGGVFAGQAILQCL